MQKYQFLQLIGEGSYGKVFRAFNTETNEIVAVKRNRSALVADGIPPTTIREISLLWALSQDKHIVKLLAVEHVRFWRGDPIPVEPVPEDETHGDPNISKRPPTPIPPRRPIPLVYMIFEHLDLDLKGLMDDHRKRGQKLAPSVVKESMFQLLTGVCFCHSHGILHRDLKPQNILVDEKHGFLKLADFGLGREFSIPEKRYTSEVVTLWYRAPELLLLSPNYSTPVDIWSLGCIFVELASLSPIFHAVSEFEQLLLIFKVLGTPTEAEWQGVTSLPMWNEFPQWKKKDIRIYVPDLDNDGVDLLSKMLLYNPSDRISARSALAHPYFSDLDAKFVRTHQLL